MDVSGSTEAQKGDAMKSKVELTQELFCVDCRRNIRNDKTVYNFRSPATFACRECAAKYYVQAYRIDGIDLERELSYRATTPVHAIRMRIYFCGKSSRFGTTV